MISSAFFFLQPSELCGLSPQQTAPIHSMNLTKSLPPHFLSTSPPPIYTQSSELSQDYSRLHHFHAPGNVPTHHGGVYTHAMTQPMPIGQQKMHSQHYMLHYSPSKNMLGSVPNPHNMPTTNHIQVSPHHSYTATGLDSVPSSQFQSGDFQNQSPSDAMKSISSGSSLGSGGESVGGASSGAASSRVDSTASDSKSPEILYRISDEEDETSADGEAIASTTS